VLGVTHGAFAATAAFVGASGNAAAATGRRGAATVSDDLVDLVTTMWMPVAALHGQLHPRGLGGPGSGLRRRPWSAVVRMACLGDTCRCRNLHGAVGSACRLGEGNGVSGHQCSSPSDTPATDGTSGIGFLASWLSVRLRRPFSTITSGAMAGRTSFERDLLAGPDDSAITDPVSADGGRGPGAGSAT
jgi:Amt family ammonium transporter